jgi:hypothetical protein
MKTDPKYGYFPWWPQDDDRWIHPQDVSVARQLIPSRRVFRRDGREPRGPRQPGEWLVLHYGDVRIRVLPTLWREVRPEGFEMGDWVEVLSRGLTNTPRTGVIREILWDPRARALCYLILENEVAIETEFHREDLRRVEPVNDELSE